MSNAPYSSRLIYKFATMNIKSGIFTSPETNRILYVLLLIATPFLLLQNYLQSLIGELSDLTYKVGHFDIPVTVTVAFIFIIIILSKTAKKLNSVRIIGWIIILFLFWIGQQSTDYYFNHKYYELQYNWHYFAYALFAYINYRAMLAKGAPAHKIILIAFLSALATSTLDEFLQMPLSNRIFDVGDISKDLWGTMIGLFFIYIIIDNGRILKGGWKISHPHIKDYFKNPLTLLVNLFVLSYIFMVVASLLTETQYIAATILFTIGMFFIFFLMIHLSQKKILRRLIVSLIAIIILVQGFFFIKYFNDDIIYNKNNILVYKGIPVIYFDVLIYPNGVFRLVDKKINFNKRDQQTIFNLSENIIIFGTGVEGDGGQGFPLTDETQFVFDESTLAGKQIILQSNADASTTFNRIKSDNRRPTFIYHNN